MVHVAVARLVGWAGSSTASGAGARSRRCGPYPKGRPSWQHYGGVVRPASVSSDPATQPGFVISYAEVPLFTRTSADRHAAGLFREGNFPPAPHAPGGHALPGPRGRRDIFFGASAADQWKKDPVNDLD
jgi:hypothetical protein